MATNPLLTRLEPVMEGTIGDAISWWINDGHSPRMSLGL